MSIFAPVYRPRKHQQTFLVQRQKLANRKRKRDHDSDDEDGFRSPGRQIPDDDQIQQTPASAFHPVNQTDPYHVTGHPRELPLPPAPFPHAAIKEVTQTKRPIDEELAQLNPPLYVPPITEDKSTSLRRRHLDNVTTILHRCMLNGDWQRAYRAWSLLIRTEIAGRGIDVRRNGRWVIGAEVLMRSKGAQPEEVTRPSHDGIERSDSEISLEGFKLAREYYERLILQYPHTASGVSRFNATAIYPALFNIWIYEIQERSKRERKAVLSDDPTRNRDEDGDLASDPGNDTEHSAKSQNIRIDELAQATQLAQRMDELFQTPPYDTDTELRKLRGMVARWIADLPDAVASHIERTMELPVEDLEDMSQEVYTHGEITRQRALAADERRIAEASFEKAGGR